MKSSLLKYPFMASLIASAFGQDRVNLSESAVENLGIEVVESEEITFESTFFVIGRLQEVPSNHSVVSSRIAGRVTKLNVISGDHVEKGDVVIELESRTRLGILRPQSPCVLPPPGSWPRVTSDWASRSSPSKEMMDILDLTKTLGRRERAPAGSREAEELAPRPGSRSPRWANELVEGELIRFRHHGRCHLGNLRRNFPDR